MANKMVNEMGMDKDLVIWTLKKRRNLNKGRMNALHLGAWETYLESVS